MTLDWKYRYFRFV